MPLVHVEHRRLEAERAQRAHAADAEHELLPQPVRAVAAVEPVGDRARPVRVAVDVGVEQVERHAADLRAPDLRAHGDERAVVVRDLDGDGRALERERQPRRVVLRIALALPVGLVELLAEVALAVEEPDADERHAEVGRRLQVVAGEHAEPARVDRQALVEPELAREVGDAERVVLLAALPPRAALALGVELAPARARGARRTRASPRAASSSSASSARSAVGLWSSAGEALGVELLEERARAGQPGEPEVAGELAQRRAQGRRTVEHMHGGEE